MMMMMMMMMMMKNLGKVHVSNVQKPYDIPL